MNRKFKITPVFILFSLLVSNLIYAQPDAEPFFEGTLSFAVSMKGPQADMLKLNKPNNKMQMHIKEGDYIVNLMGGEYPKTFIFVADSNFEYSMDMANKRAYRFSMHSDMNKEIFKKEFVAKPTGNQVQVNGITCDEYKMKRDEIYFTYYVNDKYRVNIDHYPKTSRAKASFLAKGLDGRIPLKTIKKQRGLTVITEAKKVTRREFDPEQFRIPQGFEVKMRDYRY